MDAKNKRRRKKIKALLDDDFLSRLVEVGKLYGWAGDYVEIRDFIQEIHRYKGIEITDKELEPYDV